jgi:hypothetical protein
MGIRICVNVDVAALCGKRAADRAADIAAASGD